MIQRALLDDDEPDDRDGGLTHETKEKNVEAKRAKHTSADASA